MKVTQAQYVKRLEKMLKVEKPCSICPATGTGSVCSPAYICKMCNDFVGLSYNPNQVTMRCPCWHFIRSSTALKRAHKAIIAYKAGEHRWNK